MIIAKDPFLKNVNKRAPNQESETNVLNPAMLLTFFMILDYLLCGFEPDFLKLQIKGLDEIIF